jgi:hypothetical protein
MARRGRRLDIVFGAEPADAVGGEDIEQYGHERNDAGPFGGWRYWHGVVLCEGSKRFFLKKEAKTSALLSPARPRQKCR